MSEDVAYRKILIFTDKYVRNLDMCLEKIKEISG